MFKLMVTRRTIVFVTIGGLCLRSGLSDIGKGLITIAISGTIRQHLRLQQREKWWANIYFSNIIFSNFKAEPDGSLAWSGHESVCQKSWSLTL